MKLELFVFDTQTVILRKIGEYLQDRLIKLTEEVDSIAIEFLATQVKIGQLEVISDLLTKVEPNFIDLPDARKGLLALIDQYRCAYRDADNSSLSRAKGSVHEIKKLLKLLVLKG